MKTLVLACISLAACFSLLSAAERTNVLFIAVDDLNDWIGCLGGHPQALTPNIDRLAARGMLFTNAHCAAPACNPSRAALFSGLMPNHTKVWSNDSDSLGKLKPDALPLTVAFEKDGYETLGAGKLLHGSSGSILGEAYRVEQRWSPLSRESVNYTDEDLPTKGTDHPRHVVEYKGKTYTLPLNGMPSDRKPDYRSGESFDWGAFDVPAEEFGDTQITTWALEKIDKGFDKPFFLGVGYYRPHIPLWAPAEYFERFEETPAELPPYRKDDLEDIGESGKRWAIEPVTAGSHATTVRFDQWREAVEAYLACVTYVDHEIGRLLDALDQSPYADNTLIVLWGDHGWHLGEKDHWGKWTGWERATRVPLMMVPPKNWAGEFAGAGSRCDRPVGLIDLYPTLAEICAVPAPENLDGESLVPLFKDPERETGRKLVTLFDEGNYSVRTDRYRYIRYAGGEEELYDRERDPNEWTNLANNPEYHSQLLSLREFVLSQK